MNTPVNFITTGTPVAVLFPDGKLDLLDEKGEPVQKFESWQTAVSELGGEPLAGDGPKMGSKAQLTMIQKLVGAESYAASDAPVPAASKSGKAKGTGRLDTSQGEIEVAGQTVMLDPDDIEAGPNPRGKTPNPEEMAEWMRQNANATGQALIQNIVVGLPIRKKGKTVYPLLAGWTRHAAALLNKASKPNKPEYWMLRAVIFDVASDERRSLGLMENLGRVDMNPVSRARAYRDLMDKDGWKQIDIAKRFGFSNSTVSNMLSILELPKSTLALAEEGKIDQTWLVKLAKMKDDDRKAAIKAIEESFEDGASPDPLGDVVKEAVRANRAPAGTDDDGDDEETEETETQTTNSRTAEVTKLSRKEIMEFLEDNHAAGAEPVVYAITDILIKVFEGERKQHWGAKQLAAFTRANLPDTGIVSDGKGKGKGKGKAAAE